MRNEMRDRLYAGAGIASVVAMLAGVGIEAAGGRKFPTVTSSPDEVAKALAHPAGTMVWAGAYLEMLSYGCFLAFAAWACLRLGGGLLGGMAGAAGAGYAALSIAALAVGDAVEYRAGHGIGVQLGTALFTIQEALYVGTWFLSSFFLLAAGGLALACGRRALGWAAFTVAGLTLVLTAISLDNLGQMANFLWLLWIVWASVALARQGAVAETHEVGRASTRGGGYAGVAAE
jgi:hypothetical protein